MKLNEIHMRDPYILPYEGTYYLYGKKDESATIFWVYKSSDLENWSEAEKVFEAPVGFWATKEFWAPEVHIYNDKFYMFASFKADGKCRGTQILVADKPDGQFLPLTETPITPDDWECLDGTLYVDKKGKPHIVFCHEWTQIGDGTVCEMELSEDLKTAVYSPRLLWKASDHREVVDMTDERESKITDGPYLYRLENGELICIWSSFNKNGYIELIARSDNQDIDGNWTIDEKLLSAQDGGHGMIFETFSGQKMFVMHCPNVRPEERPLMRELVEKDGMLILK